MGGGSSTPTGACGVDKDDVPTLGIYVEDVSYANTDGKIVARVRADDSWSDWTQLDNPSCNDRERGNTDFYDNFESITAPWQAVAIYNCDSDGVEVGGLEYWDGSSKQRLEYFCDNVVGPSVDCYAGAITPGQEGACYSSAGSEPYYEGVWLDQDQTSCPGMNVAFGTTSGKKKKRVSVGKVYYESNPGVPDCASLYPRQSWLSVGSIGSVAMFGESASMEMILIICAVLMMVVFVAWKLYTRCKQKGYKQLPSSEETQPLNNRV